jgi:hypothetical protein
MDGCPSAEIQFTANVKALDTNRAITLPETGAWAWGMGHGAWGMGHGAWGMERIVFIHALAFLNFFNSSVPIAHCPLPIAHCPLPIAHCPLPHLVFRGAYTVIFWFSTSSSYFAFSLKRQLP